MKLLFLSNYLTHHQLPLCNSFFDALKNDYCFIETSEMTDERKNLGWELDTDYPYVIHFSEQNESMVYEKIAAADVIILGDCNLNIFKMPLKKGVQIYFYRERLFKRGFLQRFNFLRLLQLHLKYLKFSKKYDCKLLCASAYAHSDFSLISALGKEHYKWGYFPENIEYDVEEVLRLKEANECVKILWAGRIIGWKRAADAVKLAKELSEQGVHFTLDILGCGKLEKRISKRIKQYGLNNCVTMRGSVTPEKVREYMLRANVFIATSDQNEGWGAVVNEAMNSMCVVFASHLIGSAPYLIENTINGFVYKCGDIKSVAKDIAGLSRDKKRMREIGKEAYKTISCEWNAQMAVQRFLSLTREKNVERRKTMYQAGICSIENE